jgi:hypothetical protein
VLRTVAAATCVLAFAAPAAASPSGSSAAESEPPFAASAPSPAEKKLGYALPFAMRPAIAGTSARIDAAYAVFEGGTTIASTATGGYKVLDDFAIYVRAAFVHSRRDGAESGTAASNPLVFALYTPTIAPSLRLAIFGGTTAPIGAGGGNSPDPTTRATMASGIWARQAMDNALFATNYITPTVGIGLALVRDGFTVQVDTQVLQLLRARGDAVDTDSSRTNFTSGVLVGWRFIPLLTASVEAHYQRWLSTPAAVEKDGALREQATAGIGLRANLKLDDRIVVRPGIAYFHPIDDPMAAAKYRIVQLDVPFVF